MDGTETGIKLGRGIKHPAAGLGIKFRLAVKHIQERFEILKVWVRLFKRPRVEKSYASFFQISWRSTLVSFPTLLAHCGLS
jgi:hypothetical protein